MDHEKASEIYLKLKPFLAVFDPAGDNIFIGCHKPFFNGGEDNIYCGPMFANARWMPDIVDEGWRRLQFKEFMELYNIEY